jgi:hypothetical protein
MKKEMPLWGAVTILVLFVGLMFWGKYNAVKNGADFVPDVGIDTFAECAKHFPVMESYPEQCNTPDGQHFVNPDQHVEEFPPSDGRVGAGYISGKVTIGPNCPVEIEGEPCETPTEAYTSRNVLVFTSDKSTLLESATLSIDGTYTVAIGPGNYFVQINPAGIGEGELKPVTVTSFETSIVDFDIDTGIR